MKNKSNSFIQKTNSWPEWQFVWKFRDIYYTTSTKKWNLSTVNVVEATENYVYGTTVQKTSHFYLYDHFCCLQYYYRISPRDMWQRTYPWVWDFDYESFSGKVVEICNMIHFCVKNVPFWHFVYLNKQLVVQYKYYTYKCRNRAKHLPIQLWGKHWAKFQKVKAIPQCSCS